MAVDKNMNVLVVDDYQTMIRIIKNLLKQLGFNNVDEATDGTAAFDMLSVKKYGLVISDWNMEPMSGFELLQKVREETATIAKVEAEPKLEGRQMMMVLAPGSVREPRLAEAFGARDGLPGRATVSRHRSFREMTETGVVGDARRATPEKGQACLDACADALAGLLREMGRAA